LLLAAEIAPLLVQRYKYCGVNSQNYFPATV
jgi:hypothetical protein